MTDISSAAGTFFHRDLCECIWCEEILWMEKGGGGYSEERNGFVGIDLVCGGGGGVTTKMLNKFCCCFLVLIEMTCALECM